MIKKLKVNDLVIVISGAEKKKIGKLISVNGDLVCVEGVNVKNIGKKRQGSTSNEKIKKECPIHKSNISLVENGLPIKISIRKRRDRSNPFSCKIRISKKTGKNIT